MKISKLYWVVVIPSNGHYNIVATADTQQQAKHINKQYPNSIVKPYNPRPILWIL